MSTGDLVEVESGPVKTVINSLEIGDIFVSVVISKFSNKLQLLITESGKISVWYETTKVKGASSNPKPIHEITCLFGSESEESLIAARILSQEIPSEIPIIIGFGLDPKYLDPVSIKKLVDFVQKCLTQ